MPRGIASSRPQGILATGLPGNPVRVALELLDRRCDRGNVLFGEEHAGRTCGVEAANGLGRPPAAIGDHRRAARLGLDRYDPEILLGREHERLCPLHQSRSSSLPQVTEQFDVPGSAGTHLLELGSVAHDDKTALRHAGKCLDDSPIRLYGTIREAVR